MATFIALLRGINVGGNTILPMAKLKDICIDLGFKNVKTYIQSGNLLFNCDFFESQIITMLETALDNNMGKKIPVIIRTKEDLEVVISKNPFPGAIPAQVGILFFRQPISENYLKDFVNPGHEEIVVSGREIYIHYPNGMGRSKLKLPKMQEQGTVRNINTVAKLAKLSKENY
jgi:uncharacterized protein (DUF1697 family)